MQASPSASSGVWKQLVSVPDTPPGFTVRTTLPGNPRGVETMLESWEAGSAEPPHAHPGDDMTVVVEGEMVIRFFRREKGGLVADGAPVVLQQGQTGYIPAGRIHDARYTKPCKLVYVHDGPFGFAAET
jgi:mannose-6-phosphate isomerase-like protein (cupin superfamily)